MRLSKSWTIASKDFKTFKRKRNLIYSIVVIPLMVSILFPIVIDRTLHRSGGAGIAVSELLILMPTFTFFYVIISGIIPAAIASYTIVGEKVERTLEPLLATPTTDSEILFGKGISAFVPSVGAILGGSVLFMVLMDLVTHSKLGYYYFPNWNAAILLLLIVPLAVVLSVEWNVIVSARVTDIRVAQQVGMLSTLPFAGIYILSQFNIVSLGVTGNLLIIAGILLLVDALLLYVARATFQREEILTRWK